jgi:hypothetical protein
MRIFFSCSITYFFNKKKEVFKANKFYNVYNKEIFLKYVFLYGFLHHLQKLIRELFYLKLYMRNNKLFKFTLR